MSKKKNEKKSVEATNNNRSGKIERMVASDITLYRRYQALKTIFYCLGFPLLFLVTFYNASKFFALSGFVNTAKLPLLAVIIVWAVVGIAQLFFNKKFKGFGPRVIFVVALTLIMMLMVLLIASSSAKGKISKAEELAKSEGSSAIVPSFAKQKDWYRPYTKGTDGYSGEYAASVDKFKKTYNVELDPSIIREKENTDGSTNKFYKLNDKALKELLEKSEISLAKKNTAGEVVEGYNYFLNGDAYYTFDEETKKTNGLYGDGFVFGTRQVRDIIKVDTVMKEYFKKNGGYLGYATPDDYLLKLLKDQNTAGSAYKTYLSSGEVDAIIGESKGKYGIDETKINGIINALQAALNFALTTQTEGLNLVQTLMDMAKVGNIAGIFETINSIAKTDLKLDAIFDLLSTIAPYQASKVKPAFMFIPNVVIGDTGITMREYALAQYYGKKHGAVIGSVILPNKDGKIGQITMNDGGKVAADSAMTYQQVEQLMVDKQYKPQAYPALIVRRSFLVMTAIILFFLAISTYFGVLAQQKLTVLVGKNLLSKKQEKAQASTGGEKVE